VTKRTEFRDAVLRKTGLLKFLAFFVRSGDFAAGLVFKHFVIPTGAGP
jgi:hypothetical protein